jgi:hypothetical protein
VDTDRVPVGDLIVMTNSANHGATASPKASCSYQLNLVRAGTDQIGLASCGAVALDRKSVLLRVRARQRRAMLDWTLWSRNELVHREARLEMP